MSKIQRPKAATRSKANKQPEVPGEISFDNIGDDDRALYSRLLLLAGGLGDSGGLEGHLDNRGSETEDEGFCSVLSRKEVSNPKQPGNHDLSWGEDLEENWIIGEENGERNLVAAVVLRAFRDAFGPLTEGTKMHNKRDARKWLQSKSKKPWSYRWCLEALDIYLSYPEQVFVTQTRFLYR